VLAVFAVVVEHTTHQAPLSHPELGGYPFSLPLRVGASTMLVISAFFVCVTVRKRGRPGWLWNRIARLVPAYLVAVLLTYVVTRLAVIEFNRLTFRDAGVLGGWLTDRPVGATILAGESPWYLPTTGDLVANLLMIQGWSPEFHAIDAAYWTMPVQIVAFVIAALLFPMRWARGRHVPIMLWSMVIIPVIIRYTVRTRDAPQWVKSVFDGLAMNRTQLFAVGIAIWLWSRRRLSAWHLAALLLAALVAQDAHAYWLDTPSTAVLGVVLLAVCAAARGPDWNIPVVRAAAPVIAWLAGVSYGVYLVHQQLGFALARTLRDAGAGSWVRLAAVFAFAVLLGWLLTRLVERPSQRWLTRAGPALCAFVRRSAGRLALFVRGPGRRHARGRGRAHSQGGSGGGSPARPLPSDLPVSQRSAADEGPPIVTVLSPAVPPASSQPR